MARFQDLYSDAAKLALAAWPRSADDKRPMLSRTIDVLGQALAGPLEVLRLRHDDPVMGAAFSPDSARAVTTSEQGNTGLGRGLRRADRETLAIRKASAWRLAPTANGW